MASLTEKWRMAYNSCAFATVLALLLLHYHCYLLTPHIPTTVYIPAYCGLNGDVAKHQSWLECTCSSSFNEKAPSPWLCYWFAHMKEFLCLCCPLYEGLVSAEKNSQLFFIMLSVSYRKDFQSLAILSIFSFLHLFLWQERKMA